MKIALTDMGVQKLKPGTYFDTKTGAFGIRVGKHRRTWIVTKGQHPRVTVTIGHYPAVSLQDARKRALVAFLDPDERRSAILFADATQEFLSQDRWRPQTKRVLISNLHHFTWQKRLSTVTRADIVEVLDGIDGDSARWHAKKDITTFFNWCVPRYLDRSPATGIRGTKQRSRDRILTDGELRAVWIAAGEMGYPFGNIVRLLILKGQRCGEIARLRSTFIEGNRVRLPASVTKNGREHSFPISAYDVTLLPEVGGLLFPNAKGEPFTAFAFNHKRLLKRSGTSDWTLHDLRRTFATGLARLGTPIHVTEKVLNHASGTLSGVAAIYNRFDYWDEQVAALAAWERHVLELCRDAKQPRQEERPNQ